MYSAGKRVEWRCLGPATQDYLETERDPRRKRTEVYVSCPRAIGVPKKSCKESPNSVVPQRTQEPTQVEEEDLMLNKVVHFYCQVSSTNF